MARLSAENPYKRELIGLMHSVEAQIGMEKNDIMLILLDLDTEEKIWRFFQWFKTQVDGNIILAKPNEIVRAACEISDELDERDAAIQQLTAEMEKRGISETLIKTVLGILKTTDDYLTMIDALSSFSEPSEKNLIEAANLIVEVL